MKDISLSKSRHYLALDGLRGLAAFSVVIYHIGHWLNEPWLSSNAGLWVDFFFALSGYVMAIAYSSKLDSGMSFWRFSWIRIVRLLPVIVIATLISASYLVARVFILKDSSIGLADLISATLLGLLCLPMFGATQGIGGPQVFPLNGPQYTLFLELLVNAFWAAVAPSRALPLAAMIMVAGYTTTAVIGLGGDDTATFWAGIPRVFGSYYAGVVIFLIQRRWAIFAKDEWRLLFWPSLLLTLILFWWPSAAPHWLSWMWTIAMPPLLIISGSKLEPTGSIRLFSKVLGELSYPIYALHYPIFVWINAISQVVIKRRDFYIEGALIVVIVPLAAWIILKLVDEPVRSFLSRSTRVSRPARAAGN